MFREAGAGRNEVAHDHVFFEPTKPIHLTKRSRFGKHASRILERCGRNEAIGLERSLGNSQQYWHRFCGFTTLLDHALVFRFEVQFIDLITPQQRRVAGIGDLHLAQHLPHNDLDVLIVNLYALEPVNFLNFVDQVFLQVLRSTHFQDFVWYHRAFGELLPFPHKIALEDDNMFRQRNEMLLF